VRAELLLLGCLALLVVGFFAQLYWSAGELKTLEPHFAGSCIEVTGLAGAEDLTIHPRTGLAYVSAFDRRAALDGRPARGAIYAYARPRPSGASRT
jgi:arylesterase/paraoxonase